MGVYYGTSTWHQGISPTLTPPRPPHPAASSSNCVAVPTVSSGTAPAAKRGVLLSGQAHNARMMHLRMADGPGVPLPTPTPPPVKLSVCSSESAAESESESTIDSLRAEIDSYKAQVEEWRSKAEELLEAQRIRLEDNNTTMHWGDFVPDARCASSGHRGYSSRLWNVTKGMGAQVVCENMPARVNGVYFDKPTWCEDKVRMDVLCHFCCDFLADKKGFVWQGLWGVYGHWILEDKTMCSTYWEFTRKKVRLGV
ncbi:hypothetical protein H0H92_003710 [Tricholoma furcatifolium]|nr:hypothetical protein H0H92_003710 [Tricholoma furcatifolium]